jgi:hypothetical protein
LPGKPNRFCHSEKRSDEGICFSLASAETVPVAHSSPLLAIIGGRGRAASGGATCAFQYYEEVRQRYNARANAWNPEYPIIAA